MRCWFSSVLAVALWIAGAAAARAAEGSIIFNNRLSAFGVDAPVTFASTGEGPGPAFQAGLYVVGPQGVRLIPGSVTAFRDATGKPPAMARYIVPKTVEVPGTAPGGSATLRMRVWRASAGSYEAAPANQRAESADIVVPALGGGTAPPNAFPKTVRGFAIPDGPARK